MGGSHHCYCFGCRSDCRCPYSKQWWLILSKNELDILHDYYIIASYKDRIYKLDNDYYSDYKMLSLVCFLKYHVTLLLSQRLPAKMVGIVNIKVFCENMIGCMYYYFPKQGYSLWFIAGLLKQHIGLYCMLLHNFVRYKKATQVPKSIPHHH